MVFSYIFRVNVLLLSYAIPWDNHYISTRQQQRRRDWLLHEHMSWFLPMAIFLMRFFIGISMRPLVRCMFYISGSHNDVRFATLSVMHME
ncbi:unnamed protein product, partial [Musa textilis]